MYRTLILTALILLVVSGCTSRQDVKETWKFTTRQYRTYLNTPAYLDLEDRGSAEDYELVLSDAVLGIDVQLEKLVRAMENSGKNIGPEWVMSMMQRFPWLTGMALVDNNGTMLSRYPEFFSKEFSVTPLLEEDNKQSFAALRAYVQPTPLGYEVYVASPIYINQEFRGMVVAHFDPRSLLSNAVDPGNFMIASPEGVLWAGNFDEASTPVGQAKWGEMVQNDSSGFIGSGGKEFFWLSRYLGNLPLVYALPVDVSALTETNENVDNLRTNAVPGDAPPLELRNKGLAPGEVGNLGSPNVAPQPAPAPKAGTTAIPIEE